MEERRKIYRNFLALHANKAGATAVPTAHVMFHDPSKPVSPAQPLIAMSVDNVLAELDKDSELVRWLLRQLTTYDCRTQKIVALVFDRTTVLSDVFRCA